VTPVLNRTSSERAISSWGRVGIAVVDAGEAVHLEVDEAGREVGVGRGRGNQLLDAVQEDAAGKLDARAGEGVQSQTFHDNTVLFTVLPQGVA
jgi:hypothetical protein